MHTWLEISMAEFGGAQSKKMCIGLQLWLAFSLCVSVCLTWTMKPNDKNADRASGNISWIVSLYLELVSFSKSCDVVPTELCFRPNAGLLTVQFVPGGAIVLLIRLNPKTNSILKSKLILISLQWWLILLTCKNMTVMDRMEQHLLKNAIGS